MVMGLVALGLWTKDAATRTPRRADPPVAGDLTRVPEVAVANAVPHSVGAVQAKMEITQLIGTIRTENAPGQDAFVLANMERRPELRGLPFVMGNACRQPMAKAVNFQNSVSAVRDGLERDFRNPQGDSHGAFWQTYLAETANQGADTDHGIAALTQILAPKRAPLRASLIDRLKQSNLPEATRAIARTAIFDSDGDIRMAAIKALKDRPKADYDDVLLRGLRYPLASVSRRSAQAMLALNRTDLLPKVAAVLDEAARAIPWRTKWKARKSPWSTNWCASIIIAIAFCAIRPRRRGKRTKCPA